MAPHVVPALLKRNNEPSADRAAMRRMLAILDSAALELAEEHVPHTFVVQLIASAFQFVAESIVNAVLGDGKDAKQFATAQNAFSVLVFFVCWVVVD